MDHELGILFDSTSLDHDWNQYRADIIEHNILNKPTAKSRALAFRHLSNLYGLDPRIPLFRILRMLWSVHEQGHSVLAMQIALSRDPLLRSSQDLILEKKTGEQVSRTDIEAILRSPDPERFSSASLKSFAQNINGSWTRAGFLQGKVHKTRVKPEISFVNVVFSLFFAYLEGASGERLFQSRWTKLLGLAKDELEALAVLAAQRGIIDFKHSGGVIEVRFPGFLTPTEEQWRYE